MRQQKVKVYTFRKGDQRIVRVVVVVVVVVVVAVVILSMLVISDFVIGIV